MTDVNSSQAELRNVPHHQNIGDISATGGSRVFAGVHVHAGHERPLHEILPVASQAPFDASSRQDDPLCLEDTRTEVLKEIRAWVYGNEASSIFWLNGMAGTGKSTIARTIARELSDRNCLGASFFFVRSGGSDVSHAGMFFTTIAYQLAIRHPDVKHHIVETLRRQPDIATKARGEQWRELVAQPLEKTKRREQRPLIVMVIDALDECDSDNDMKGLIAVLAQAGDLTAMRLRVIVTSRPETPIRLGFRKMPEILHRELLLHEVARDTVDTDICLFLYSQLEEVKEMYSLPEQWPSVDLINQLVEASAGLFIFAATVCRYLQECEISVEDALDVFLPQSGLQGRHGQRGESTWFLDAMYSQILDRSRAPISRRATVQTARNPVRDILGAIAALSEPLPICSLAGLLEVSESDIRQHLSRLHSVVRIPTLKQLPIRLHHASLRDFLFDKQRNSASGFRVDRREVHAQLLQHCLAVMESKLRRNVCDLPSTAHKASEVDGDVVNEFIPPYVQYACQHWVQHFCQSQSKLAAVSEFLSTHLLYWIEAMALIDRMAEAIHMIVLLEETVMASEPFADFVQDTLHFLRFSHSGIKLAPLQVYESALLFAPNASNVRQRFSHELPRWISRIGKGEEKWDACFQVPIGHSQNITRIVFSPDGKTLASASRDCIMQLWDTTNGRSVHKMVGHTKDVLAMAFSLDGKTLTSVSRDQTVRLWDTASGCSVHELELELVGRPIKHPAALSPDGTMLASASGDCTVRLWDMTSGRSVHELIGRSKHVLAMTFSPDGKVLFSSSPDRKLQVWDTTSGHSLRELDLACDSIFYRTVFSPDGKMLASASTSDGTVQIWDTSTGLSMYELVGHSQYLLAMTFSPDGKVLASSSGDLTLRLWNTNGSSVHKLINTRVEAEIIALSPDGKLTAWRSGNCLQLCDVSRSSVDKPSENFESVYAVIFSPNGKELASVNSRGIGHLWDTSNGAQLQSVENSKLTNEALWVTRGKTNGADCWPIKRGWIKLTAKHKVLSPRLEVGFTGDWLYIGRSPTLWIPPKYKVSCISTSSNMIALGHETGLLSLWSVHDEHLDSSIIPREREQLVQLQRLEVKNLEAISDDGRKPQIIMSTEH